MNLIRHSTKPVPVADVSLPHLTLTNPPPYCPNTDSHAIIVTKPKCTIAIRCVRLDSIVHELHGSGIVSKGLRVIKENNNLVEWSRQVEECRSSGLSVRSWCEQNGIAVSTFHYRQQKVWDALQERNQFVEVPLQVNEYRNENIAATVHIGEIRADIHNGADEATLTALVHALKSC